MTISINNPVAATQIFTAIFAAALLLSLRRKREQELFPVSATQEMKGLAILAIVFAHVGYGLVADDRFLFPLSILAGVGVDLFLFLSGYGLVLSSVRKNLSAREFYRSRLLRIFIPLWISIAIFFLLDFFVLHRAYAWGYIISSFAGIFPRADLFLDLNSPLWYFTLILFYYLIFPLVFSKKRPWLSAAAVYAAGYFVLSLHPAYLSRVLSFYELHDIAFPLGMAVGAMFCNHATESLLCNIASFLKKSKPAAGMIAAGWGIIRAVSSSRFKYFKEAARCLLLAALVFVIAYTAYNSGMDRSPLIRQLISLTTMSAIVILFLAKRTEFGLLTWFGVYSYEIYLLHWPILSRYDIFFRYLPGALAMMAYLAFFLGLGRLLQETDKKIIERYLRS